MSARRRIGPVWLLAGLALGLLAGRWIAGHVADRAFFEALGFGARWRTEVFYTAALSLIAFVLAGAFAFANFFAVRQSIVSLILPRQLLNVEFGEAIPTRRLTLIALGLSFTIALVAALLPHDWSLAAMALDGVPFREFDPYLERDLGFYVVQLPWELGVLQRSVVVFTVVSLLVVFLYAGTPSVRWSDEGLYLSTWVRRHLAALTSIAILLVGWDWRLDRYRRLSEGSGIWGDRAWDNAFAAFDHRIALPYLAVLSFATIPIATVFLWSAWRDHRRVALSLLSALILLGPVANALLPLAARGQLTTADARARETPYLNTIALFTRRAYGVDDIARDDAVPRARLSPLAAAHNVSAWDPAALAATMESRRGANARALVAWHAGATGLEALALIQPPPLAVEPAAWPVLSVAAARANADGSPLGVPGALPRRLAPVVVAPGLRATIVAQDSAARIAAPAFVSTFQRVTHAWAQQSPRLLFADESGDAVRIITHRDVRERVLRVVPFLTVGNTVTPIVRADSLHWSVELFVTSPTYPLTQGLEPFGERTHFARHAATALVQAQTGRVILVSVDQPDPVTQFWMRKHPELFGLDVAPPAWFVAERPPVIDLALVQGAAMAQVGLRGDTLSRRWLARADDADAALALGPPALFQVDASGALGWGVAMDLPASDRTLGVLVSRGGAVRRSELHDWSGARRTTILEELQRAADVAGFGRERPNLHRGRVQALPGEAGVIYVQSSYEWLPEGAPRLAGVVVMQGGTTRAGATLAEALSVRDASGPTLPAALFRARVEALYDALRSAQRAGDWAAYAEAWNALGRLLGRPAPASQR